MHDSIRTDTTVMIFRHPPYGQALAREGLEAALAGGALGADIAVVYLDDGVLQLLEPQHSAAIHSKNHHAMGEALAIYDVEKTWIDGESLRRRNIPLEAVNGKGLVLDRQQLRTLLAESSRILSF